MKTYRSLLCQQKSIAHMSIVVRGVTKFYGEQKALDNVSFEVKTGEIVGFLDRTVPENPQ